MLGIFDSGLGGLTVIRAIEKALPNTAYIYYGDTARLPYGTKSLETISKYAEDALKFLHAKGANIPIVACHTASSALIIEKNARKNVEAIFPKQKVYDVVTPAVKEASLKTKTGKIGILGTDATIRSQVYENALQQFSVTPVAASVLVGLAEEGFSDVKYISSILTELLAPFKKEKVDTVVLACTHFPILANSIHAILGSDIELIDPGHALAKQLIPLRDTLMTGPKTFYATDIPEDFAERSSRFLGRTVNAKSA